MPISFVSQYFKLDTFMVHRCLLVMACPQLRQLLRYKGWKFLNRMHVSWPLHQSQSRNQFYYITLCKVFWSLEDQATINNCLREINQNVSFIYLPTSTLHICMSPLHPKMWRQKGSSCVWVLALIQVVAPRYYHSCPSATTLTQILVPRCYHSWPSASTQTLALGWEW